MSTRTVSLAMASNFKQVAKLLDRFFFFDALLSERPDDPEYTTAHVDISVELLEPSRGIIWGYTKMGHTEMGYTGAHGQSEFESSFTKCVIIDDGEQTVAEGIATLVHEMIHAYLWIFSCHQGDCYKDVLNNIGAAGHGPVFVALYASIMLTIRGWDKDLSDFELQRVDHRGLDMGSSLHETYRRELFVTMSHRVRFREQQEENRDIEHVPLIGMVDKKLTTTRTLRQSTNIITEASWKQSAKRTADKFWKRKPKMTAEELEKIENLITGISWR